MGKTLKDMKYTDRSKTKSKRKPKYNRRIEKDWTNFVESEIEKPIYKDK